MAIYNEILSARISRMIQKLFAMKGPAAVRQISGEVLPVIPFFIGAENRFLEGWNQFAQGFGLAAVAGNFNFAQLRNPSNSGVIGIIYKIGISEALADSPTVSYTRTGQVDGTVVSTASLDGRNIVGSQIVASSSNQAGNPSLGQLAFQAIQGANFYLDVLSDAIQEIVITPGMTVRVSAQTVNQGLFATFFWRERPLEESEKQF